MTQEKLPHRKELCLQSEIPETVKAFGIFLISVTARIVTSGRLRLFLSKWKEL